MPKSDRSDGAPSERIDSRPVNSCIHPAGRPINTSMNEVLRGPVEFAQYCSNDYQAIHQRHGLLCSMTDGYDCYQNALAKRVNGILKGELLLQRPADLEQARQMVRESVQIYNSERPHLSLKMQTPDAVHRASLSDVCRLESSSQVST